VQRATRSLPDGPDTARRFFLFNWIVVGAMTISRRQDALATGAPGAGCGIGAV